MQNFLRSLMVLAAFVLTAQADEMSTNRVDFNKVEINGHPARLILITSMSPTLIFDPGAKRLGLKGTGMSDPVELAAGGRSVTAPVPVLGNPIERLPWIYRQLIIIAHPILYHEFKNLYAQMTVALEGILAWPEVRNNILVFDSDHRVIRRVEQLPPETAGWLKLKIVPDRCLLLEAPMTNGAKGVIWVDTADTRGVLMPPAPWKEWTASHPDATVASHKLMGLPLFITSHHEAWADEVQLGPLALRDVTIQDMPEKDESRLLEDTPSVKVAWTMGVSALMRLDMVVDANNGWAYLHPKPPVAMNKTRGVRNWTVADNVRLGSDMLFVYSGEYKWTTNDFTGAAGEFTRALELNPRNYDAYSDRGAMRQIQGDDYNAVADYDKAIALKPGYSEWERLWRQALLWRLDRLPQDDSKTAKAPDAVALKPVVVYGERPKGLAGCTEGWTKTLGQFLVGRLDEDALLEAAKTSKGDSVSDQKALAYYYIGMMRLSKGDKAGARGWFQKCKSAGMKDDNEYYYAVAELKRLETPPPE